VKENSNTVTPLLDDFEERIESFRLSQDEGKVAVDLVCATLFNLPPHTARFWI
jgi:hypothetical protein